MDANWFVFGIQVIGGEVDDLGLKCKFDFFELYNFLLHKRIAFKNMLIIQKQFSVFLLESIKLTIHLYKFIP